MNSPDENGDGLGDANLWLRPKACRLRPGKDSANRKVSMRIDLDIYDNTGGDSASEREEGDSMPTMPIIGR